MTPDNNHQVTYDSPANGQNHIYMNPGIGKDRQLILEAKKKGIWSTVKTYIGLSGPGWLQSGITLGGGSLASSLYLGVLVGFSFMWLQPLAMILGIIMLSAISYVTLSTGQRPLRGINEHVSPVLGFDDGQSCMVYAAILSRHRSYSAECNAGHLRWWSRKSY